MKKFLLSYSSLGVDFQQILSDKLKVTFAQREYSRFQKLPTHIKSLCRT